MCWVRGGRLQWVTKHAADWAIKAFENAEFNRSLIQFRGTDRRSSSPFISGDGFRAVIPHVCEDANRCRMDPLAVKNGSCVFVKTDMFDFFVKEVSNRIQGSYIIVSHNGDLSAPDGQDDAPRIGMPRYITSDILSREYASGRLIAHHGQNLWWKKNISLPLEMQGRPVYSHCLPIGVENRQYTIGRNVQVYIDALRRNIIHRPPITDEEMNNRPLLLVAFYPKSRVPDRQSVLHAIGAIPPRGKHKPKSTWYNETDLSHLEWLDAIGRHKFVLAPFGHGLDTHRITEIFLMGGIPVMRKSTISSCYDDTDNEFRKRDGTIVKRGSLPLVLLDSWKDLSKERLEAEWERLRPIIRTTQWDWKRLFIDSWLERIDCASV